MLCRHSLPKESLQGRGVASMPLWEDPSAGRTRLACAPSLRDCSIGVNGVPVDSIPKLKLGDAEQPQRVPRVDGMMALKRSKQSVDVVDAAFTGDLARQDVTQGSGEGAGQPRV